MISDRAATILIGLVATMWATNLIGGMVLKSYEPDPMVNGIFTLIVGGAFAVRHKAVNSDKRDDDK